MNSNIKKNAMAKRINFEDGGVVEFGDWISIKSMSEVEKLPRVKFKGDSDEDFYYVLSEGNGHYEVIPNEEAKWWVGGDKEQRLMIQAVVRASDYEKLTNFGKGGGITEKQKNKIGKVMHEFKEGKLHSGSKHGPVVTNERQAIAIALAEAGKSNKNTNMKDAGGNVETVIYEIEWVHPEGKLMTIHVEAKNEEQARRMLLNSIKGAMIKSVRKSSHFGHGGAMEAVSKETMLKNITAFLEKFPRNATSWRDATDEIRDLAKTARELVYEQNESYFEPVNFREIGKNGTPAQWNTEGRAFIVKMVNKMNERTLRYFYDHYAEWFENEKMRKGGKVGRKAKINVGDTVTLSLNAPIEKWVVESEREMFGSPLKAYTCRKMNENLVGEYDETQLIVVASPKFSATATPLSFNALDEDGQILGTTNSLNKMADIAAEAAMRNVYFDIQAVDANGNAKWLQKTEMSRGGNTEIAPTSKQNKQMVASDNKSIAHHTRELANALSRINDIPAWVVAKVNRSATDISDVTHYLDGQ